MHRRIKSEAAAERHDALVGDGTLQYSLHQFLVDLFGSLLPGLLFLTALLVSILPTAQAVFASVSEEVALVPMSNYVKSFLRDTSNTPNVLWIGFLLFYGALGYVIGTHFHRQDPKDPDRESFAQVALEIGMSERIKYLGASLWLRLKGAIGRNTDKPKYSVWDAIACLCQFRCASPNLLRIKRAKSTPGNEEDASGNARLRVDFGCTTIEECEFPYPFIYRYLEKRGHKHLLNLIPWNDGGETRSKTFINRLKIRLQYYRPATFRRVTKSEADVRLSISMWYVARELVFPCICCLLVVIASMVYALRHDSESAPMYLPVMLCPAGVLLFAWFSLSTTQKFIHYQRLREVYQVLETAYTAFRFEPKLLSADVVVDFSQNGEKPVSAEVVPALTGKEIPGARA